MLIYSHTPVLGWNSGNKTSKNYTSLLFSYSYYPEAYIGTNLVLETSAGFNKPNTDVLLHTNQEVYMFKSGLV
jgi:hypothetical protein